MRTTTKSKVTFEKMIILLNKGLDKYLEELGTGTYRNPSFVFVDKSKRG